MDGASNYWISRKITRVLTVIKPSIIVVQWSYPHRQELNNCNLPDEVRRVHFVEDVTDSAKLLLKSCNLIKSIEADKQNTKIIHSFIPDSVSVLLRESLSYADAGKIWESLKGSSWGAFPKSFYEFNELPDFIISELGSNYNRFQTMFEIKKILSEIIYLPEIKRLDIARDGHHYDLITATDFVDKLVNLI